MIPGNHSMILTEFGTVYGFGFNSSFELGIDKNDNIVTSPTKVPIIDTVVKVACGWAHTVAVTDKGQIFSFGCKFFWIILF